MPHDPYCFEDNRNEFCEDKIFNEEFLYEFFIEPPYDQPLNNFENAYYINPEIPSVFPIYPSYQGITYQLYYELVNIRTDPMGWGKDKLVNNPIAFQWLWSSFYDFQSYGKLAWSESLGMAARHYLTDYATCETSGDQNGNTFEEILSRYYAYAASGVQYAIVDLPDFEDY